MKCIIPEISWHNRDPVLSVDIQPRRGNSDDFWRLASGGTDAHVLIWYIKIQDSGVASLEFAADLVRHQKAVNVVRFSPSGEFLASGDDESVILIWKQKTDQDLPEFPINDDEGNAKEQWILLKVLRGHVEDVYDLCWSPDSNSLISGSVDNSAIFWDVQKGRNTCILKDHKGFVQGVAWDPQNQFVATMSSDRLCRIFSVNTKRVVHRIYKSWLPGIGGAENPEEKVYRLYHDDTLKSFFRRLSFTPDGELLITPAGVIEQEGDLKNINVTYIYSRHLLNRPVVYLPTGDKYTIAVRCCPVLYELHNGQTKKMSKSSEDKVKGNCKDSKESNHTGEIKEEKMEVVDSEAPQQDGEEVSKEEEKPWEKNFSLFALPYRAVFAVATQNSVLLYDTQQPVPFAKISNIHYTRLTDITWRGAATHVIRSCPQLYTEDMIILSNSAYTMKLRYNEHHRTRSSDGRILVVSSTDGYCSVITFTEEELGVPYKPKDENVNENIAENCSTTQKLKKEENKATVDDEQNSAIKKSPSPPKEPENIQSDSVEKKKKNGTLSPVAATIKKDQQMNDDAEPTQEIHTGCFQRSVVLKCNVDCGSNPCVASTVTSKPSSKNPVSEDSLEKMNNTSPSKNSNGTEHFNSPSSKGNITPAQEQKKTPRRVQLITLSSPKSKKRLL